jgi:hypothetical protein
MRRFAVIVAALALAPSAQAAGVLRQAAQALRSDPVYVAPGAEEQVDAARVRSEIESSRSGPVYVAVLPASAANEAGGDPTEAVHAIAEDLHRRGTYAGVIGNHFRALSDVLPAGEAGDLAAQALDAHGSEGATATLVDFVDRVASARNGGGSSGGGRGSGAWLLPLLVVGGIALFLVTRNRGRRRQHQVELAQVKEAAHDDLIALAGDVQELETRVRGNPQAQAAYDRAAAAYADASGAFDRARSPDELAAVARALDDGRYEMTVAEAALAGRPAPPRTPPCFFDPRHGPSSREVEWAPPGGAPRLVPACEADALRVERGGDPDVRQVAWGGRVLPYYAAPPMFGGYFGGFLPGLLLGELMGGGLGWGWGGGYWDAGGGDVVDPGGGFDTGDFGGDWGGGGDLGGGGDFDSGGGGDF